jgi:GTP cyclohydrolase IA
MQNNTARFDLLEKPVTITDTPTRSFENLISCQLLMMGEDPSREGLLKTPARVAKSLSFLTRGYREDPKQIVNGAIFETKSDEMVIVKGVEFYSLCEHHLLPFFGSCHIAYLPKGKIIGLSKVARLVEIFSRRLQVQERLTQEIAEAFSELIPNHGVGVVMKAEHLCMKMRGIQKQNSHTITSALLGKFRDDAQTRLEFLTLIQPLDK